MNILTEFYRSPGIDVRGKTIYRTAVRGVALRGRNLLMIHSSNVGDYKFPGGGVADGENHVQALSRELQEECGVAVLQIGSEIGAVIEYDIPIEKDFDVFRMISHYYWCNVTGEFGVQKLDDYEQELGFQPVWIEIAKAIQLNKELLYSGKTPEWLSREIFILEHLHQHLKPGAPKNHAAI